MRRRVLWITAGLLAPLALAACPKGGTAEPAKVEIQWPDAGASRVAPSSISDAGVADAAQADAAAGGESQ